MTQADKENKVKKYFTLPIEFVEEHQIMKNCFSYQRTIEKIKITVTPCGKYLLINIK